MGCSTEALAKRAFVSLLLSLGAVNSLVLKVNRESADKDVLAAYRRVLLKVHPDKGGKKKDFQRLHAAKEKWESTRGKGPGPSQPEVSSEDLLVACVAKGGHRVHAQAVLLTYFGKWSQKLWSEFLVYVRQQLVPWSILRWCATLEMSEAGKLHVHLQLQFRSRIDRLSKFFAWRGRKPNANANDYLGFGFKKANWQQSIDRAFFYVFADKEGTQRDSKGRVCVEGNHQPVWTDALSRYQVLGKWAEDLWKRRKLSHAMYEKYLYACRDGVTFRKRNLDAVRQKEEEACEDMEREAATKRVRSSIFVPFPEVPEVTAWLSRFQEEVDRYPFLVVLGPSRSRKTEYAKSLFKAPLELKIGTLEHFPSQMRSFSRKHHDAIVLDDCRDFAFLVQHQEKLQGKVDAKVEFASTPGGQCAFTKWLHRIPIVVTANFTTKNRNLFDDDDFLGNAENRVVVNRTVPL